MFNFSPQLELTSAIIRNPIVVSPKSKVVEAITKMSGVRARCFTDKTVDNQLLQLDIDVRSSCVLVVDNGKIEGIITERDVVRLSAEQLPLDVTVAEVMARSVVTLRESAFTDLFFAINLIQQHHIRHLPIVDDSDRLVGLVTYESLRQTSRPIDLLRLRLVNEVMTREVICAAPDDSILAIAKLMANHRISSVIIVETQLKQDHRVRIPVGILTERDIVQFQALGLNLEEWAAEAMMSSPLFTVSPKESLWMVHQIMEQRFISRIAVVSEEGEILGIITQTSLLQALSPIELYNLAEVLEEKVTRLEAEKISLLESRNELLKNQQVITYQQLQEELIERKKVEAELIELNHSLEIKVAERTKDLLSSEANVRAMIEAIPDLLLRVSRDGRCLEYISSMDSEQNFLPIPQHLSEVLPPNLLQQQLKMLEKSITTGDLQVYEHQLQRGDRVVFEEIRIVPIGADEALIIVRDQTERKQAELALQKSETRFRRVFESNIVGMMFTDFNGQITDANDRFLELLGYSREDLIAKRINWETITPAEYLPSDLHALQHLKLSRIIAPWEKVYYHKDGHLVHVLIGLAMLSEEDCVCVVVDISDRKQAEEIIRQQVSQETLLREITQRIRHSLDIHTVFNTACQEIRSVIHADRVGIFKFDPDSGFNDGEFVAESVGEGFSSAMAIPIHDHCFGEKYAPLYLQGRYAAISDIYQLQDQCHMDVLERFQVRANLVMPLFYGEQLWGLLCIHQCSSSRCWHPTEINFIQQISVQLGISLQQASLYEQVQIELRIRKQTELELQQKAEQSKLLQTITQRIRSTLNLDAILKTTVQEIHQVLNSDRVLVYRVYPNGTGAAIAESASSQWSSILDITFPEEVFPQVNYDRYVQGRIFALTDREAQPLEVLPCLADFLADIQVRAKLVVPIIQNDALWGLLIAHQCDRPRHWQPWEINLLQQIANQLAIAIQQADLFVQLQQELRDRQQTQKHLTEINQRLAESNEELARATRLKDEFLANMSHELRTPLNAILGMTEGMQEQVFGRISNAQIKALQTIERSGSHLLELINDILDVAKIESGQIELEYSTISVESLCQSSLTFVKQQALKKSIQLETKLAPNLPELIVDERRIRQVLINLLNNAVKFTPDGGHITVEVSRQPLSAIAQEAAIGSTPPELDVNSYLHIAISDTGIGIAPENISKLFQPFIQIDSALNRQYQGTGLGLALVKRIVEMHGGKVMLASEVGVGSCFTIILPCTESASAPVFVTMESQTELVIESGQIPQTAPVILLAEDNEANVMTVSSYLTAKGYVIVLANNGEEAIALARSAKPDLILMDIQMPVMDGLEATKQIRQIPDLMNVPIIALTALAMENDIKRCIDAGASDYLSKPVKLRQLTKTIQQFLDLKRLEVK